MIVNNSNIFGKLNNHEINANFIKTAPFYNYKNKCSTFYKIEFHS